MGSLGGVTKAQAQYNWVSQPNCTEWLHLLQRGNGYSGYSQYFVRLLDSYCLNPGISNFDFFIYFHDFRFESVYERGVAFGFWVI